MEKKIEDMCFCGYDMMWIMSFARVLQSSAKEILFCPTCRRPTNAIWRSFLSLVLISFQE